MHQYTYLLIDILTVLFPFVLSFDKKVAFYRQWKFLWPGLLITGGFFIGWDILFTSQGIWRFSSNYTLGITLAGLPVEEWLFFLTVPYACVFIYACLLAYIPFRSRSKDHGRQILLQLGILFILTGIIFNHKAYTFSAFTLCGLACLLYYPLRHRVAGFRADAFLVMFLVSLVPFLVVNGLLTSLPVVIYNDAENLGLRLYTIPVEDIVYGMLLMLGNVLILEWMRSRKAK